MLLPVLDNRFRLGQTDPFKLSGYRRGVGRIDIDLAGHDCQGCQQQ
jgi:hypothetical protein